MRRRRPSSAFLPLARLPLLASLAHGLAMPNLAAAGIAAVEADSGRRVGGVAENAD